MLRAGRLRVRVHAKIDAPPQRVWAWLGDISSHPRWMSDAVAVRFTSPSTRGVGTTFECETRVGPFRLTDTMEVTEWKEGRVLAVRHTGAVSGTGRFVVRRRWRGGTSLTWHERLAFPWWMGGPFAAVVAAPVLRRIWRRDLAALKRLAEHR